MRVQVTLACEECKRRNYRTMKNKKNNPDRIEFKKYCRWCGTHTSHKETSSHPPAPGRRVGLFVQGRDFGPGWWRRAVAPMEERRSPKPDVGGSSPSCPASSF